jgi:hypothetical protein
MEATTMKAKNSKDKFTYIEPKKAAILFEYGASEFARWISERKAARAQEERDDVQRD